MITVMIFIQNLKYKKFLVAILSILLIVGLVALYWYQRGDALWVQPPSDTKDVEYEDNSDEWIRYEAALYDFSFEYPRNDILEETEAATERILRIQNYDSQIFSHSLDGKYWIEFFVYPKEGDIFSCTQHILNYEVSSLDGVTVYKGFTASDSNSGVGGGYSAMCLEHQDYDLYIQGQDFTGVGTLEHIINTIQFTD